VSDTDRLKLQVTQKSNENELLRSQFTKAANQAEAAEKKFEELKVNFNLNTHCPELLA